MALWRQANGSFGEIWIPGMALSTWRSTWRCFERAARTGETLAPAVHLAAALSFLRQERAGGSGGTTERSIERAGLDVVRRPTGGRAVWHARELTYAVAAPADAMGESPDCLPGDSPHAADRPPPTRRRGLARRASPSVWARRGRVFRPARGWRAPGRTAERSWAARSYAKAAPCSSTAPSCWPTISGVVGAVTRGGTPDDGSAPLGDLLGREISADEAAVAVADAAKDRWGEAWTDGADAPDALTDAEAHLARFRSERWTWSR